ncbi:hypothetical protein [Citrobacter koseri]|nr:hypothetical protein [Citrobacter koseri]STT19492.1 Uncharacterised protein [Citrobacter koseri]
MDMGIYLSICHPGRGFQHYYSHRGQNAKPPGMGWAFADSRHFMGY